MRRLIFCALISASCINMGCAEIMMMHMMGTPEGQAMIRGFEGEGETDSPEIEFGFKQSFFAKLHDVKGKFQFAGDNPRVPPTQPVEVE